MTENLAIGLGTIVTIHFALKFEDGEVIDSNFDGDPPSFTFGDGSLLPGFEEVLVGLKPGDHEQFTVPPEKAFGQPNPSNIQSVSRESFDPEIALEEGLVVSFADAAGGELPGVVRAIEDNQVTVDFNHPLAGRAIVFDVKIIDVNPSVTH